MKLLSILFMMTIMLAQNCGNRSTDNDNANTESTEVMPVIKMVKNPCFGQCPIYALTISNDGLVEYVGQRFATKMGTFTKQIPTEEVAGLVKEFENIKFMEMDENYPTKLPDLPKTIITLFKKDTSHTVTGDSFRPEALVNLDAQLVAIADSKEGWTLTKKHPDAKKLPDHFIKNEIITKFHPDIDIPDFIKSKKHIGMTIKKRVAPNLDLWVITFDTAKIDPSLMLMELKESPSVMEAEFNKQLYPRED